MKNYTYCILLIFIIAASCTTAPATEETGADNEIITPVTITTISADPMIDSLELNATSTFLKKSYVKAPANGYITSVNAQAGITVTSMQNLFNMKTKEAQSIGNAISALDTSFRFSGTISIKGGAGGYVSEVNHQLGDYVQEGEQLAVINDTRSLVFILNLPYELRPYVLNKKNVALLLPDGKRLQGILTSAMPVVDSASQT
ncbi:MAG: HlyD family secretion protein, partial [Flavitalea sp.]